MMRPARKTRKKRQRRRDATGVTEMFSKTAKSKKTSAGGPIVSVSASFSRGFTVIVFVFARVRELLPGHKRFLLREGSSSLSLFFCFSLSLSCLARLSIPVDSLRPFARAPDTANGRLLDSLPPLSLFLPFFTSLSNGASRCLR